MTKYGASLVATCRAGQQLALSAVGSWQWTSRTHTVFISSHKHAVGIAIGGATERKEAEKKEFKNVVVNRTESATKRGRAESSATARAKARAGATERVSQLPVGTDPQRRHHLLQLLLLH